jgi:ABC-type Mn2+/Zn2+ transport system ATPase subunit
MDLFRHGSIWLRADFHLHTKSDKEAFKAENDHHFADRFVERCAEEQIHLGIITNHNKFELSEYRSLSRLARKQEIFLLPGVELSVAEGAGVLHVLIVFEPKAWLSNHDDFINRFLNSAFPNLPEQDRVNNNASSPWNVLMLLEELKKHKEMQRDSFIVLAHVDQKSGFCTELNPGRQTELVQKPLFKEFVLGFQKCTSDKSKQHLKTLYKESAPTFVEGSDNKEYDEIGYARTKSGVLQKSYIKLGDFNFAALKNALMDESRNIIAPDAPSPENAYIYSIKLETASSSPLNNIELCFNPDMNNLIGIRGSGKSTIIESLRYALDKKLEPTSRDSDYKEKLVNQAFGSGGKMSIKLIDRQGKEYLIVKVLNERTNIFQNNERLPLMSADGLVNILYFGQKDLSEVGSYKFSQALMEKFFGADVALIRERIDQKEKQVLDLYDKMKRMEQSATQKNDMVQRKEMLLEKLKIFKEKQVDQKLNRQVQFDKDKHHVEEFIKTIQDYRVKIGNLHSDFVETLVDFDGYKSTENQELFKDFQIIWEEFFEKAEKLGNIYDEFDKPLQDLSRLLANLNQMVEKLQDDFAEIKRSMNQKEINPDDFLQLNKTLNVIKAKLFEVETGEKKYLEFANEFYDSLDELNDMRHKEYKALRKRIDVLNDRGLSIKIELDYRGDKQTYLDYFASIFKGSGVTARNLERLTEKYEDGIQLYFDYINKSQKLQELFSVSSQYVIFEEAFKNNLRDLVAFQVPNRYILKYKDKDISAHSLGQRASALLVFLLARQQDDIIIIDQPEDDIDNQSIYQDIIRELNRLKGKTQFIFATHNPNIPVLGECEQVFCCTFEKDEIEIKNGNIDSIDVQSTIIEIMEGGKEAFLQRKRKYNEWKL